jgi:hypothetical protein
MDRLAPLQAYGVGLAEVNNILQSDRRTRARGAVAVAHRVSCTATGSIVCYNWSVTRATNPVNQFSRIGNRYRYRRIRPVIISKKKPGRTCMRCRWPAACPRATCRPTCRKSAAESSKRPIGLEYCTSRTSKSGGPMAIYYTPSGLVKEDGRSGSNIALRVARKAEAEWPIYHTPSGSVKEDV